MHTFHAGEGVPDFELAAVAVHPDLELHRLELLPLLLVAPAPAAAAEKLGQVVQSAAHTHPLNPICPLDENNKKQSQQLSVLFLNELVAQLH